MKYSDTYKGAFLKAADLKGSARTLTIGSIELEEVGNDGRKPVVAFAETDQKLVLNKTNASVLATAYGNEMGDWEGKLIVLRPDMTDFGGKRVPCLRVGIPTDYLTPGPY